MADAKEPFGPWGEPFFAVVSGDLNTGKSTDILYSCPTFLHIAQPGGLKPAIGEVGYRPKVIEAQSLDDVLQIIDVIPALIKAGQWPYAGVAIDDLTLLAGNTETLLATARDASGNLLFPKEGNGVFRYFDAIRDRLVMLKMKGRFARTNIVACAHLAAADDDLKKLGLKGGPKLPMRKQVATLPGITDTLLRVVDPTGIKSGLGLLGLGQPAAAQPAAQPPGGEPVAAGQPALVVGVPQQKEVAKERPFWANYYACDPHNPDYYERDRHGVFKAQSPMNFGEGMRAAGYYMPRPPGLEWIEQVAQAVASDLLAAGGPWEPTLNKWRAKGMAPGSGLDPYHLRWALRDGWARAEFVKQKASILNF